ncbi:hypothetical protein ACSBM8_10710 [Sphingomonas sp. ASY06-1R]|uniref:hypothetical protein n=1 Tax=Sphingomonas sp. ASY06-1R TaxID=3445771 RepID=UPI003FA2BCC7
MTTTPMWGPFRGPHDAAHRLSGFADVHVGPDVGICWATRGGIIPIRKPSFNADGYGSLLVVQFDDKSPLHPGASLGFFGSVAQAFHDAMEFYGEAQLLNSQVAMAQGQMINHTLSRIFSSKYRSDGIGVALDVLAVVLTVAAIGSGVGAIAMAGFVGGCALLTMDGSAYVVEIAGYDDAADSIKRWTEVPRIIATAATLPDAAYGGYKIVREMVELKSLRAASLATAGRAEADAARVGRGASGLTEAERMNYAQRYAEIGERARARASDRAARLRSKWAHEVMPRATVPGSVYLLVDDELKPDNENMVARYLRQYAFHVTSVRRNHE